MVEKESDVTSFVMTVDSNGFGEIVVILKPVETGFSGCAVVTVDFDIVGSG